MNVAREGVHRMGSRRNPGSRGSHGWRSACRCPPRSEGRRAGQLDHSLSTAAPADQCPGPLPGVSQVRLATAGLLFLGLMLDTVDGMVARKTGQTTLFGSVLDIAVDRTYELVLWVCFADLRMISAAIPLIVIARTTLTDAFRSIGVAQGTAPFAQHHTALGRFLVGSTWMRVGYSVVKITTFCGLALAQALDAFLAEVGGRGAVAPMTGALRVVAWVAVLLCVLRGLPVIVPALRQYWPRAPMASASKGERREPRRPPAPVRQLPAAAPLPSGLTPFAGSGARSAVSRPIDGRPGWRLDQTPPRSTPGEIRTPAPDRRRGDSRPCTSDS